LFKGTPRAFPDSSPRASADSPTRLPQMLEPTDRTSFPPGLRMLSVGPRQQTRGCSPRSPVGAWVLLQEFYREIWSEGVVRISTSVGDISAGFGDARAAGTIRGRCNPGGVAVRRAPEPGPVRGDRVVALRLVFNAPSPSLRETEGEVSATPIDRVADCGLLVELLVGGSGGRPCPVR
jgi:hypothetical protein